MSQNQVKYKKQHRVEPRAVWFSGDVALLKGQIVCYDIDDTDPISGTKSSYVAVPKLTNNRAFAGVVARAYLATTGGQSIEIYEPGSVADILVDKTVFVGDYVTGEIGGTNRVNSDGRFSNQGFTGRGTARITEAGTFSASLILVEAFLMDGEESGLTERILPVTGAAVQSMIGGMTYYQAVTIAGDCTTVLADGGYQGQKKGFLCEGAVATSNIVVTVTSGLAPNPAGAGITAAFAAMATITLDGADDYALVEWNGLEHMLIANKASVIA